MAEFKPKNSGEVVVAQDFCFSDMRISVANLWYI